MPALTPRPPPLSILEDAAGGLSATRKALGKHWPTVLASVLLCGGAALVESKATPRVYEAQSTIEITRSVKQPLGDKDNVGLDLGAGFWDAHEYYSTQYKVIESTRVLQAVVRDLSLQTDPGFLGLKALPATPVPEGDVVEQLRGRIAIEPINHTTLILLKVTDGDPKRARRICDAVANTFISQNLETAISATTDAVVWLNGQVDHIKRELDNNENDLHKFKEENDLPSTSINEASNMLRLEMAAFDEALTHTRTKKQELLARQAELALMLTDDNPAQVASSELLNSSFLSALRAQYLDAVRNRDSLVAEGKGENHPLMRTATERIAGLKSALLGEVRNIKGAVEHDLAVVNREEAGESALFEASRRKAVDLNMKEIEYHRLDRAREQNEKLFELLLSRMKEADIARMMKANNIRVVDVAAEPKAPIRPRTPLNVAIGLFVGLVFGIGLVIGREQLDNSLKTPQDLEQKLGITFLGLLPELDEGDRAGRTGKRRRRLGENKFPAELVVHEHPLSGVAEAARSIRTNLMFMNPDHPFRKLLITSAAPAEGKTTVACSIAVALAQGGQRVCIVDGDLRRPRLHRIFDRVGDPGVTSVILGEATVDEVTKPTVVENLWSVPAGPVPPNPADLLHSDRFKKFLADLAERFDRVVIDSPPIVPVTDSAILSTLVDGTVFVVRAFKTTRTLTRQGLRALRDVDSPLIGAVLNAVNLNKREYNEYYYYYQRDGYRYEPLPDEGDTKTGDERPAPPPN